MAGAPQAAIAEATVKPRLHPWAHARQRLMELVIVFVGVYSAFLLNRLDSDRRDRQRQSQLLDALEREFADDVRDLRADVSQVQAQDAAFDKELEDKAMPPLAIYYANSSYSATDDATILQAGGLELLDVQTIELLRKVNDLHRMLQAGQHNAFELSLVELANHSSQDFYDPATGRLRSHYEWYPMVIHKLIDEAKELVQSEEALLGHLRAERQRRQ